MSIWLKSPTLNTLTKSKFCVYHEARQSSQLFSPDRFRCFCQRGAAHQWVPLCWKRTTFPIYIAKRYTCHLMMISNRLDLIVVCILTLEMRGSVIVLTVAFPMWTNLWTLTGPYYNGLTAIQDVIFSFPYLGWKNGARGFYDLSL